MDSDSDDYDAPYRYHGHGFGATSLMYGSSSYSNQRPADADGLVSDDEDNSDLEREKEAQKTTDYGEVSTLKGGCYYRVTAEARSFNTWPTTLGRAYPHFGNMAALSCPPATATNP